MDVATLIHISCSWSCFFEDLNQQNSECQEDPYNQDVAIYHEVVSGDNAKDTTARTGVT